jgi:hypothetical protein
MRIKFLGTGSAFTLKNYQSNLAIEQNGKRLLLYAGGDIRSLRDAELNQEWSDRETGAGFDLGFAVK